MSFEFLGTLIFEFSIHYLLLPFHQIIDHFRMLNNFRSFFSRPTFFTFTVILSYSAPVLHDNYILESTWQWGTVIWEVYSHSVESQLRLTLHSYSSAAIGISSEIDINTGSLVENWVEDSDQFKQSASADTEPDSVRPIKKII